MTRDKDTEYGQDLFDSLTRISDSPAKTTDLFQSTRLRELRKMKKFRFQLLHRWLTEHFAPARVADIGGGKGLLAYLLQQNGWQVTVIDPVNQALPDKYKDISSGKRMRIAATEKVSHINQPFAKSMGCHFDMLVGMHAHGCNAKIINAATKFGCGFVLFPCCVIDEPFYPPLGVQWLESVTDYAVRQGHTVYPFRLNFKGQNIGLCSVGNCIIKILEP